MPKTPIHRTSPDWWPDTAQEICRLADMPKNSARGFTLYGDTKEQRIDLIIWRDAAEGLRGFVNKCPHMGLPLETFPDRFLNAAADTLICSAHGAQFHFDGNCFAGPCQGAALRKIELGLRGQMIVFMPA